MNEYKVNDIVKVTGLYEGKKSYNHKIRLIGKIGMIHDMSREYYYVKIGKNSYCFKKNNIKIYRKHKLNVKKRLDNYNKIKEDYKKKFEQVTEQDDYKIIVFKKGLNEKISFLEGLKFKIMNVIKENGKVITYDIGLLTKHLEPYYLVKLKNKKVDDFTHIRFGKNSIKLFENSVEYVDNGINLTNVTKFSEKRCNLFLNRVRKVKNGVTFFNFKGETRYINKLKSELKKKVLGKDNVPFNILDLCNFSEFIDKGRSVNKDFILKR